MTFAERLRERRDRLLWVTVLSRNGVAWRRGRRSVSWRPEGDALGTWLTTITFPDGTVRYCDYSTAVEAMVGPRDSHHRYVLQEEFDLIRDDDGVRHLCEAGRSPSVCGREVTGEPLGLYFPAPGMGGWTGPPPAPGVGGRIDPPPAPDLFAEWNAPDLCRTCFMTWLTKPPPVGPPEDPPVPAPKSSWWTALQRLWQG
jgi:hypothetical protein